MILDSGANRFRNKFYYSQVLSIIIIGFSSFLYLTGNLIGQLPTYAECSTFDILMVRQCVLIPKSNYIWITTNPK